jgi:predicted MFS family arabinose efflux permease
MHIISPTLIPIYYAVSMGAGAIGALALGRLYDINRTWTVLGTFLAGALFAPLVFLGGPLVALAGMLLWGIGLAAQESLLRPLVAVIVDPSRRATAFGLFDTGFGIAWFIGSVVLGYLYGISILGLVVFSVLLQLIALAIFAFAGLRSSKDAGASSR